MSLFDTQMDTIRGLSRTSLTAEYAEGGPVGGAMEGHEKYHGREGLNAVCDRFPTSNSDSGSVPSIKGSADSYHSDSAFVAFQQNSAGVCHQTGSLPVSLHASATAKSNSTSSPSRRFSSSFGESGEEMTGPEQYGRYSRGFTNGATHLQSATQHENMCAATSSAFRYPSISRHSPKSTKQEGNTLHRTEYLGYYHHPTNSAFYVPSEMPLRNITADFSVIPGYHSAPQTDYYAKFPQDATPMANNGCEQTYANEMYGQSQNKYHNRYLSQMSSLSGHMARQVPIQVASQHAPYYGHHETEQNRLYALGADEHDDMTTPYLPTPTGAPRSLFNEGPSQNGTYGEPTFPQCTQVHNYHDRRHGVENITPSPNFANTSDSENDSIDIRNEADSGSPAYAHSLDYSSQDELGDDQGSTTSGSRFRYQYLGLVNKSIPIEPVQVDVSDLMAPNLHITQSDAVQAYSEEEQKLIHAAYAQPTGSSTIFEQLEGNLDYNFLAYYQSNPKVFPKHPRVFNKCVVPTEFWVPYELSPGETLPFPPTYVPNNLQPCWPSQAVPLQYVKEVMGINPEAETENLDLPPREPFFVAKEGITHITAQPLTICEPTTPGTIPYKIMPQYLRGNAKEWDLSDVPPLPSEPALPPQFPALWEACGDEQKQPFLALIDRDKPVNTKQWLKTVAHEPGWKEARNARNARIGTDIAAVMNPLFSEIPNMLRDHQEAMSKGIVGSREIEAIDAVRAQLENLLLRFPKKTLEDLVVVESSGVREAIEKGGLVMEFQKRVIGGEDVDAVFEDLYKDEAEAGHDQRSETDEGGRSTGESAHESAGEASQGSPSTTPSTAPTLSDDEGLDLGEFGSVSVSGSSTHSFRISQMAMPQARPNSTASPIEELERKLNGSFAVELAPIATLSAPPKELPVDDSTEIQPVATKLKMKDRVKAKVHRLKAKLSFRSKKG
ncbi:hypothetical protein P154DRAFT_624314 [Amniculicola lignicola CBS 123094]|uniref:Uncharacterized protein n=1 Tax=Amniculicola lignicola CBS 123094 TaxID=1392246 RepID=A0A6A5W119_9PLEO|nr:hypothetical protein P154DRAFT_624314 [Amniculicola lignicola CBS 123094]